MAKNSMGPLCHAPSGFQNESAQLSPKGTNRPGSRRRFREPLLPREVSDSEEPETPPDDSKGDGASPKKHRKE